MGAMRTERKGLSVLPAILPVAEAKKHFPAIVREASENLKLFRVANAQRREAPRALVIGEEALRALIGEIRLTPEWEQDVERGLWSVVLPELDIYGQGPTRDEAAADLIEAALEYAALYLEDAALYFRFGRRDQYRYVLAIALAAGDRAALARLLGI